MTTNDSLTKSDVFAPREYSFPLEEDGQAKQVNYTLRGLIDEEVKPWAAFCASIFAYKANPPPPEYFERHYFNDPLHNASLIRIAFTNDSEPKIVASCRIFERYISDGKGGSILAGGIGEVCTSDEHRRRGLSKELMKDCIAIMTKYGMKASILHSAPSFFPVYRTMGYECTTSLWSLLHIIRPSVPPESTISCREAVFPDDTAALQSLHHAFSESKFVGCIVRSEDYWNMYLSAELKGTLFVLVNPTNQRPFACLSLRSRGYRWQLREFSYADNKVENFTLSQAMQILLQNTLPEGSQKLHLPTFLVEQLRQDRKANKDWIQWDSLTVEDDQGWMYRPLADDGVSVVELSKACPHLIWPADSF
eukprot:scaffold337_cov172-Amphora_coffeaeformis.AAC.8